ncbi:MAG TPA: aldose 1-epimerase [Acidimicrobiales bacterium]
MTAATGVTVSSRALTATFMPELGMLGTSLRHRGGELLALPGGLEGYQAGHVTGLPLLAPWANRLGTLRYVVGDVEVDLSGLPLHTDELGLPIHGTMTAQAGWEVTAVGQRSLSARFPFGEHPELLASFPFPHVLDLDVTLGDGTLTVTTRLTAGADRAVPVAFGYHPYLRLPRTTRDAVRLALPDRRHLLLDHRHLPTGQVRPDPAEEAPLGDRAFDDLYDLGDPAGSRVGGGSPAGSRVGSRVGGADGRGRGSGPALGLAGGGRRVTLTLDAGYRYAQVFAPADADVVCLEPMTAPVNALVDGGYPLVAPGGSYTARFSLHVADELTRPG